MAYGDGWIREESDWMKGLFRTTPSAAMFLLLALFVVVWTAYPSLTRLNLDRYGDMVENYAWGIAWQAGYFKHPPLFAWITAGWFSLFPTADWAYYLLSASNAMLTVLASWRIALRFLDPWRAFLAAALFFFLPPVTFLAIKYNANAAMLPLWPLTVLFYLRVLERRRMADAVLLGLFAAAAMLAKYYSAALLVAIALHVLVDRQARPLLAGAAAWIVCAVCIALLVPHAVWLFQNDFQPLTYAANQGDGTVLGTLASIPKFVAAVFLYALPAALVLLSVLRRRKASLLVDTSGLRRLPRTVVGRALLWTTFGPLLLVLFLGVVFSADISSVWALPMFFSAPTLLMLLVPRGQVERRLEAIPVIVVIYCAVLLAAFPLMKRLDGTDSRHSRAPVRLIALELEKVWAAHTDAPLAIVAGDRVLANGASFYAPSHPHSMQGTTFEASPWITPGDLKRRGLLVVCFKDQASCEGEAAELPVSYSARQDIAVADPQGRQWQLDLLIALPEQEPAPSAAVR